jgi:hypothetical protein
MINGPRRVDGGWSAARPWKCDLNATTIIIPASVTDLKHQSFIGATAVEHITFEPGSRLAQLNTWTFGHCTSLKSICIAASVKIIGSRCFLGRAKNDSSSSLATVTFEPGSELRRIEPFAFSGCNSLQSISLPASVQMISADSFAECRLSAIAFDGPSAFCHVTADCVAA